MCDGQVLDGSHLLVISQQQKRSLWLMNCEHNKQFNLASSALLCVLLLILSIENLIRSDPSNIYIKSIPTHRQYSPEEQMKSQFHFLNRGGDRQMATLLDLWISKKCTAIMPLLFWLCCSSKFDVSLFRNWDLCKQNRWNEWIYFLAYYTLKIQKKSCQ